MKKTFFILLSFVLISCAFAADVNRGVDQAGRIDLTNHKNSASSVHGVTGIASTTETASITSKIVELMGTDTVIIATQTLTDASLSVLLASNTTDIINLANHILSGTTHNCLIIASATYVDQLRTDANASETLAVYLDGSRTITATTTFRTQLDLAYHFKLKMDSAGNASFPAIVEMLGTASAVRILGKPSNTIGDNTTGYGALDIWNGGLVGILLGADQYANTRTNNTTKHGGISFAHYANSGRPFQGIYGISGIGSNQLYLGGGYGGNAATTIIFYTGPTTSTLTGVQAMSIDSSQNIQIGTGAITGVTPSRLSIFDNTAANYSLGLLRFSDDNRSPGVRQLKSRGTTTASSPVILDDELWEDCGYGNNSQNFVESFHSCAYADEAFSPTSAGSRYELWTTPKGSLTKQLNFRLSGDGTASFTGTLYQQGVNQVANLASITALAAQATATYLTQAQATTTYLTQAIASTSFATTAGANIASDGFFNNLYDTTASRTAARDPAGRNGSTTQNFETASLTVTQNIFWASSTEIIAASTTVKEILYGSEQALGEIPSTKDTLSEYTSVGSIFTPKITGWYSYSASIQVSSTSQILDAFAYLKDSDGKYWISSSVYSTTLSQYIPLSGVFYGEAGKTYFPKVYHNQYSATLGFYVPSITIKRIP